MTDLQPMAIGGKYLVAPEHIGEMGKLQKELLRITERCKNVEVETREEYEQAARLLKQIESAFGMIEAVIEEFRKPAYAYYRSVLDKKKEILDPGEEARRMIRDKMSAFLEKQERLQKEKEQRLLQEAKEAAEKRIEDAVASEDDREVERALRAAEAPPEVNMDDIKPLEIDVDGISTRSQWGAEFTMVERDALVQLCRAIGAGRAPTALISVNWNTANSMARSLKSEFDVPGLRAVEKKVIVRR